MAGNKSWSRNECGVLLLALLCTGLTGSAVYFFAINAAKKDKEESPWSIRNPDGSWNWPDFDLPDSPPPHWPPNLEWPPAGELDPEQREQLLLALQERLGINEYKNLAVENTNFAESDGLFENFSLELQMLSVFALLACGALAYTVVAPLLLSKSPPTNSADRSCSAAPLSPQ